MPRFPTPILLAALVMVAPGASSAQELFGARAVADPGGSSQTVGGNEIPSAAALPGNTSARSSAVLGAGGGLPTLKIFASGASGESAWAEGVQKYRYNGLIAGNVAVTASFSADIDLSARFEAIVALFTEDGLSDTEANTARLFDQGQLRFNLDDVEDINSGESPGDHKGPFILDLSIDADLDPDTVFWVYAFFSGTALEGTVDGFSTGLLAFDDPTDISLLGQTAVPLPAAAWMLLGGIGLLAARVRRA